MSHKSGHIIIERYPATNLGEAVHPVGVVISQRVELDFPAGTSLDDRMRKIRQVERLLDRMDHDEDDE